MSYERSPSPAERGLQTSHHELSLLKRGHTIPLRTVPGLTVGVGDGAPSTPPPTGYGYSQQQPTSESSPPVVVDGVHWSQRGFQSRKDKHETALQSRSPVVSTSPVLVESGARSPARTHHEVSPPYANIDGGNPYQFREPLPPTKYSGRSGGGGAASPSPRRGYFNAEVHSKIADPVYEHQARVPATGGGNYGSGGVFGTPEPVVRPRERVKRVGSKWEDVEKNFEMNLGGNWVAMPDAAEVLHITHNVAGNRIVGVAVKDAPWSDIKTGTAIEGHTTPSREVELYQNGSLVLRLTPQLLPDGRLILSPSHGTHGQSGFWEVLPTETISSSPQPPSPAFDPTGEGHRHQSDSNTTINIYT